MTTLSSTLEPQPQVRATGAYDRAFYSGIAIALAVTAVGGFARTFYGPLVFGGPRATLSGGPWSPVVLTHALFFTAWVVLFVAQTSLIATRRVAVHRRLGIVGAILAAGMVVAGFRTAVAATARGAAP